MELTHLFFDIGGVLGTNGWDREQRARAIEHFGLDGDDEFERRHGELVGDWEAGRIRLSDYLDSAVFYEPRSFGPEDFTSYMLAQSAPFPDSVEIVRRLAGRGRVRLMTLNNEAEELNRYRIEHFGLAGLFSAFLSSCWLGVRKPSRLIFERALGIARAVPERALFVDDRQQNLAPARALGFQTLRFTDAESLEAALAERGLL
jgi:putative hydrolase of the HAD superfamily